MCVSIARSLSSSFDLWSISYPHARAPVIGPWLREANDCLGTRLIAAAPTAVQESIRINGLRKRVNFNPGTMVGRIEVPRRVLGEMEPGLVSDLVGSTIMLNPQHFRPF